MAVTPIVLIAGKDPLVSIGGHGAYVRAHGRALIQAGFEPHIFSVDRCNQDLVTDFGALHRASSPLWPDRPWMAPAHTGPIARRVERWVRERGCRDVLIHGFGLWAGIGVTAARRLTRRGIPAIAIASAYATYEFDTRARLRELNPAYGLGQRLRLRMLHVWAVHVVDRYERRGYVEASVVLVNYESVRRLLEHRYGIGSKCRKVPYTSESAFLYAAAEPPTAWPSGQRRPGSPAAPPLIVAISRHDPRKGVDVLLHALAHLQTAGVPFHACLIGGGPLLTTHRRMAARLGLGESVALAGYVPDPYPRLREADVFVLPSLRENGSLALVEALQAGLPIVASGCDGIPEDIEDGRSGLLVPPGDVAALSRALERVLRDASLRRALAQGARETFRQRFAPLVFADALGEVYAELGSTP